MVRSTDAHLEEDQLLWAVVDEAELPTGLRQHLGRCAWCGAEKKRLEEKLTSLGARARACTPAPGVRVVLPRLQAGGSSWLSSWRWRALLLAGAAVAATVVMIVTPRQLKSTSERQLAALSREVEEDRRLFAEIRQLEDNPLPQWYVEIADEGDFGFSEDFLDFVVPLPGNNTVT